MCVPLVQFLEHKIWGPFVSDINSLICKKAVFDGEIMFPTLIQCNCLNKGVNHFDFAFHDNWSSAFRDVNFVGVPKFLN